MEETVRNHDAAKAVTVPGSPTYGEALGALIRCARTDRGWSRTQAALAADRLRVASLHEAGIDASGIEAIDFRAIQDAETVRCTVRFNDRLEKLPYILRAVGLGGEALLRAMGIVA